MNKVRSFIVAILCAVAFGGLTACDKSSGGNKKPVADVYLLAGQSNAVGIAPVSAIEAPLTDKVQLFQSGGGIVDCPANEEYNLVFTPVTTGRGHDNTMFGPEVGMAEVIQENRPDSNSFIIKYAWGDTALCDRWRSPSAGTPGDLYEAFTLTAGVAITHLKNQGYDINLVGMAWMQGERDACSLASADAYADNLRHFINDVRAEFGNDFRFTIAKINENKALMPYVDKVILSQRQIAKELDNTVFLDTSELTVLKNDPWHYDAPSQLKLGRDFALSLLSVT